MGQLFENKLDSQLEERHQNLYMIPMIHRVDDLTPDMIPIAAVNLGSEEVCISRSKDLGHLVPLQLDVSKISTATAQETVVDKGYVTGVKMVRRRNHIAAS